ncbi:MAG: NADH-quinone oxidoreductase subunit C [Gammaproteobacteria bacterium]|nr:NADH-quinone oxidoreductase subunit C [Gammaproteobacteria bacterium]
MSDSRPQFAIRLEERFAEFSPRVEIGAAGQFTLTVGQEHWFEVGQVLRDEPDFACEQLMDLCGVDYLTYGKGEWETSETATEAGFSRGFESVSWEASGIDPGRFAVVVQLLSLRHNRRLRLKTLLDTDPPRVQSLVEIWNSADWFEREAFDLYGILFEGHPDLRRILTDYGFIGHPMRKDFPTSGHVEMRYDAVKQRVVYQPITIEPRVLVPRVIRESRRASTAAGGGSEEAQDA